MLSLVDYFLILFVAWNTDWAIITCDQIQINSSAMEEY